MKEAFGTNHDPSHWEYDGGSPNWTGDIEKLSPHIREVQDQLVKSAFGDRQKEKT